MTAPEAHAAGGDGRGAGDDGIEPAQRDQRFQRERLAEVFEAVEPGGKPGFAPGHRAGLDPEEAAGHPVGRYHQARAGFDQLLTQTGQAVVRRDEDMAHVNKPRIVEDTAQGRVGADEVGDEFGETHVEAGIGYRDISQPTPDSFADRTPGQHSSALLEAFGTFGFKIMLH